MIESPTMNSNTPPQPGDEEFDEVYYLAKYRDVADAVARGGRKSGHAHYIAVGKAKGRHPSARHEAAARGLPEPPPPLPAPAPEDFDPEYYWTAYPLAVDEVDRGIVGDFREHYERLGRPRGYHPNRKSAGG